jgi:hypothetical protein
MPNLNHASIERKSRGIIREITIGGQTLETISSRRYYQIKDDPIKLYLTVKYRCCELSIDNIDMACRRRYPETKMVVKLLQTNCSIITDHPWSRGRKCP